MKKKANIIAASKDGIFRDAERVFSKSLVDQIRSRGHDFLEKERDGSYLWDSEGKRYLDCYTSGGSFNLGRKNPVIAGRFMKAVSETDQGNFVMPSEEKALLARRISDFMPGRLSCVLYGVTRGESMEAACKLARGFTARPDLVTVDGGCYGESGFALSLSQRAGKEQFGELIPGVQVIPFGDIDAARKVVNRPAAAVIMEPIQAENHCRTAQTEYYRQIRSLCDETGAKLIFDESQSGFGRTGKRFFFEHLDVTPDILIIGEAITSGMFPMTAMIFTPELKGFFDIHPLIHLCTFGGHDLGCRVAMSSLDEYDRVQPWVNAEKIGKILMDDLSALAGSSNKIISAAGKGLLISLKFSSPDRALLFCGKARENGLLVSTGKVDKATVLIRPSLLITEEEAREVVQAAARSLEPV
jgi:acetylornithine/succinyldiaminopimelate/putrescine aminotransferase